MGHNNTQLDVLQQIVNELKIGGTATVVLPDNVLAKGGTGGRFKKFTCDEIVARDRPTLTSSG